MPRFSKPIIPVLLALLIVMPAGETAHAYVLQGPHILELMIEKLGSARRLLVSQRLQFHGSESQTAPVDSCHAASLPPVKHPLIRTNPANQLKNLYIGSHARSIVSFDGIESRRVLDQLLVNTTRQQDILSHNWRVGEVVMWDNRCVLHRGTGYDADHWRRHMRQTRVVGEHKGVL